MLVSDQDSYIKTVFDNEAEIETVVQKYAQQLFGSSIIYLPKAKISTVGGNGIIPDGFVIDVVGEEWFIVEAERASHGTWEHIAPQVSKQLAAAETQKTRDTVLGLAFKALQTDEELREMFNELGVSEFKIHGKLEAILRKPPTIAIPIDAIPRDLMEWSRTLRSTVKVWVIEKYVSVDNPNRVLYSLPEENAPTVTTKSVSGTSVSTVNPTGSLPFQDLISEGFLVDGQTLTMEYKPRGGQKQCFAGVVRKDGIEVEGKIFSPSYAALYCLHKINPSLKSRNGWQTWKTQEGMLLSVLRDKLPVPTTEIPPGVETTA
jgi:hypothetical protein